MYDYFNELNSGNVILSFKGSITSDMINNVLDSVESKLTEADEDSKIRKKMYNVLVESLQNLYHHIDDLPDEFPNEVDNREELKDMYKFILNHQKLSSKGGGGLGLVDIARKTGNKLNYMFQNFNNDYYFFNLDITISEEKQ